MTTFAIATLGCKVNTYESESYIEGLNALGYREVSFKDGADIYIINTCAVTNTAASKSRQKINQAKRNNPKALICVVGCFVQTVKDVSILDVDICIGSSKKKELPQLIEAALGSKQKTSYVEDFDQLNKFEDVNVTHFHNQTRAFLKIQDGCNQYCSYCIIPYARGKERSMPLDEVISKAKALVDNGHKEIVLTGIHTGRYGRESEYNLYDLLVRLVAIDGLERIRISSIEMNEISDELIYLIRDNKKIAKHLHIPIQSGSDEILKLMNRPYTLSFFEKRMRDIREAIPNISISSDIILGFPSESEEQFLETKQTLGKFNFSFLHVFPFSKRDGTKAAKINTQIHGSAKKARVTEVSFLSKTDYNEYIKTFVNQNVEVLFEYEKDGFWFGHTSEYVLLKVKSNQDLFNQLCKVLVSGIENDTLLGEVEE